MCVCLPDNFSIIVPFYFLIFAWIHWKGFCQLKKAAPGLILCDTGNNVNTVKYDPYQILNSNSIPMQPYFNYQVTQSNNGPHTQCN